MAAAACMLQKKAVLLEVDKVKRREISLLLTSLAKVA